MDATRHALAMSLWIHPVPVDASTCYWKKKRNLVALLIIGGTTWPASLFTLHNSTSKGDIEANEERMVETVLENKKYRHHRIPGIALSGYPPEELLLRDGFHSRCNDALKRIIEQTKDTVSLGTHKKRMIITKPPHSYIRKHNHTVCKEKLPNYAILMKRLLTPGNTSAIIEFKTFKSGYSYAVLAPRTHASN